MQTIDRDALCAELSGRKVGVPVEASVFVTLSHCKRQKKPLHTSIAVSGALVRPCESLLSCTVASGIAARAAAPLHHC